jgi:hypothetical protein
MAHPLEQLRDDALREIESARDEQTLEAARVKYLGRSGSVSSWGEQMKTLAKEEKPIVGKLLNEVRNAVTAAIESRTAQFRSQKESGALARIDISLPGATGPTAYSGYSGQSTPLSGYSGYSGYLPLDPNARTFDPNLSTDGLRARGWSRHRRRMALFRRTEHAARTSGAQRAGHILFAGWPIAPHAHFHSSNSRDASGAAAYPRDRARRGLSSR